MLRFRLAVVAGLLLAGCTSTQLRLDTVHQAQALNELEQQQVLDNLAIFACNPDALPYFTQVTGGSCQVNDTASGTATPLWVKLGFSQVAGAFSGSRVNQEQFMTLPVTDPYRLTWMRCVYRQAVGAPVDPAECKEVGSIIASWNKSQLCSTEAGQPLEACLAACLPACGWFHVCGRWKVPHCAQYVGHCGKTCVWVSEDGAAELGQLTTIILGLAATNRQTQWVRTWGCTSCAPGDPVCPTAAPCKTCPPTSTASAPVPSCTITETTTIGDSSTTSMQKSTQGQLGSYLINSLGARP
jgi:hypothetical protein